MKSHRFSQHPQLIEVAAGKLLSKGAKGNGVAQIQIVLNYLGNDMPRSFKGRTPDGDFGSETEQAVKRFQKEHGLKADGIIGPLTIAALDDLLIAQPCFDSTSPLEFSMEIRIKSIGSPADRPVFYT